VNSANIWLNKNISLTLNSSKMKTFNQFPNPFYLLEKKVTLFGKLFSGIARNNVNWSKFYLLLAYVLLMMLFLSSQISAQVSCCNILTNGGFESGNTEFTSGLANNCTCTVSSYCVGNNFQNKCSGWPNLSAYSGSNFLIIDGNAGVAVDVWVKTTPIVAGQKYCISFWTANVYNNTFDLGLTVNGTLVPGAIFTVQAGPVWTQHMFMWTATSSGSTIAFRQITAGSQRDFGIDDIEFGSTINANFAYQANTGCGMSVSFINQSSGAPPLSYSWDFGDPTSPNNISTLTNPTHLFTDCGTYLVCLTVFKGNCIDTICKSIVVSDLIPPVARCLGVGVVLDANCKAIITPGLIDAGSTDNCQIQSMSVSPNVLTGCGLFPVVLTVTDVCGNTSTCEADVQTIETVPPVITCPSNISVNANFPNCSINVNGIKWVTATDNCGTPVVNYVVTGATNTFGIKDASGTIFNQGVSTVTYTATDDCGNTATCSFTVTVSCKQETCNCAPGSFPSANLVVNGEFTSGTAGFSSGIPFIPGNFCAQNTSFVLPQFSDKCSIWPLNFYDHTYGPGPHPLSNFFIVDGNENSPTDVWQQNVTVNNNTTYCFSFWVASVYTEAFPLEVKITDGVTTHNLFLTNPVISSTSWTNYSTTWTCPLGFGGNRTLIIRQFTAGEKRDFGIDDICFKTVDSCACGPFDFLYAISRGPYLPYNCGDILTIPSSNFPISFLSSFQCTGSNCPQPTVDWKLTGPPPFIPQFGSASSTPNFSIPITTSTFSYGGLYTLNMIGYCGKDTCPCTIYFYQPDSCCQNYEVFCQNIMNAVTITMNNTLCKSTLNIGNLRSCDRIAWINWGQGLTENGPFVSGNMPMHTYSGSGTYVISYMAEEYDNSVIPSKLCFEKLIRDTIRLTCDSCECKSFTGLSFYNTAWPQVVVPAKCGKTLKLPCINQSQNPLFYFHGNMNCNLQNCIGNSVNWTIVQMPLGNPVASGSVNLYPIGLTNGHFDIVLNAALFTSGVQYMMTVTGYCGTKLCTCKINFTFATCPCNCKDLFSNVAQGFSISGNILSCKRTFKPLALCSNDNVTWTVSGPGLSQTYGPTIGNNQITLTFPNSGIYQVCMIVTRIDPNTGQLCKREWCQQIKVKCKKSQTDPDPHISSCHSNTVKNGDFRNDVIPGFLNQGGSVQDWNVFPNSGEGFVIAIDSTGASEDGHVILVGGKNNFAGIYQRIDLPTPTKDSIGLEFYIRNYSAEELPEGTVLEFRLQKEPFMGSPSQLIHRQFIDTSVVAWHSKVLAINIIPDLDKPYLIICLQNQVDSVSSIVGIDNIEICSDIMISSKDLNEAQNLRIFPNPNSGNFNVELPEPAKPEMYFRITDHTGKIVQEKATKPASKMQTMTVESLTNGMYFLQVVSKGRIVAVEKFVKQ
jgi:PKD repeat protein